jgi:hypothetical protein
MMENWKGFVKKRSRYYPGIRLEILRKNMKTHNQDRSSMEADSNPVPPE